MFECRCFYCGITLPVEASVYVFNNYFCSHHHGSLWRIAQDTQTSISMFTRKETSEKLEDVTGTPLPSVCAKSGQS